MIETDNFEQYLVDHYPELYAPTEEQKADNKFQRISCVYCGIYCPKGWYDLVDQLSKDLVEATRNSSYRIAVAQIKEKFGGLRFYIDYIEKDESTMVDENLKSSAKVNQLISEAEEKSFKICQTCGEPGQLMGQGWAYTACEKCK